MVLIMKTNGEIYDIVMERKKDYEIRTRARNRRIGAIGATALAVAICVTAGVAAHRRSVASVQSRGGENGAGYETSELSAIDNYEEQTAVSRADDNPTEEYTGKEKQTTQTDIIFPGIYEGAVVPESSGFIDKEATGKGKETTTAVPKDASGGTFGGNNSGDGNKWMIPATPDATGAKPGVKITGEKITDAEAKAYFKENTWIVSALSSSGVPADNLKFSDKGYCHVSYDGTEGKQLEVRQNFRDYLVYNNGKLVAIVTLTKENGKLSANPAFGGPHFDDYNAFLQKHKGEKLLFVYAGFMEIVITPDGEAVNPQGYDMSGYLDGLDNPYKYFYSEAATYTP